MFNSMYKKNNNTIKTAYTYYPRSEENKFDFDEESNVLYMKIFPNRSS